MYLAKYPNKDICTKFEIGNTTLHRVLKRNKVKSSKDRVTRFEDLELIEGIVYVKFSNRPLSSHKLSTGYWQAHVDGNQVLLHRLVASLAHWMVKLPEHTEVNHIDGNKSNNLPVNLEWCTKSENQLHKYRVLGAVPSKPNLGKIGASVSCAKPYMKNDGAVFGNIKELCLTEGISRNKFYRLKTVGTYTQITKEDYESRTKQHI